jgi:uncharacterized cupredoxin-like copper-binding protein
MTRVGVSRLLAVVSSVLLAAVALTGCSSGNAGSGSGGMGGGGGSQQSGGGMMGDGTSGSTAPSGMGPAAGYRYSPPLCAAPASLPGSRVEATLADMGMTRMMGGVAPMGARMLLAATPATSAGGRITFIVANRGWRTHELVVLPLAVGAVGGQRRVGADGKVSETGSLGEASGGCAAGKGEGIRTGQVSWVTLTLPAGRYELVCNEQNHYTDGMHQDFVVA